MVPLQSLPRVLFIDSSCIRCWYGILRRFRSKRPNYSVSSYGGSYQDWPIFDSIRVSTLTHLRTATIIPATNIPATNIPANNIPATNIPKVRRIRGRRDHSCIRTLPQIRPLSAHVRSLHADAVFRPCSPYHSNQHQLAHGGAVPSYASFRMDHFGLLHHRLSPCSAT